MPPAGDSPLPQGGIDRFVGTTGPPDALAAVATSLEHVDAVKEAQQLCVDTLRLRDAVGPFTLRD